MSVCDLRFRIARPIRRRAIGISHRSEYFPNLGNDSEPRVLPCCTGQSRCRTHTPRPSSGYPDRTRCCLAAKVRTKWSRIARALNQKTSQPVQLILLCGKNAKRVAAELRALGPQQIPMFIEVVSRARFRCIWNWPISSIGKPGPGSISEAFSEAAASHCAAQYLDAGS